MLLSRFVNGRARSNAYVFAPGPRNGCIIIDPGVGAAPKVTDVVRSEDLRPQAILLTHGHPDHLWTARALSAQYEAPVFVHANDVQWFDDPASGGHIPIVRLAGRALGRARRLRPSQLKVLEGSDLIFAAGDEPPIEVAVVDTPGHSRGSVCYLTGDVCFSGDTIFRSGVGHTGYPGGSRRSLRESIRTRLLPLRDDVCVYPGHGESTTVGAERAAWIDFVGIGP